MAGFLATLAIVSRSFATPLPDLLAMEVSDIMTWADEAAWWTD